VGEAAPTLFTDAVVILPGAVCMDLLASRWDVTDLNAYMLKSVTSVPAPVLHLRRDASTANDLSWLLVGSNFNRQPLVAGCTLHWDPNQHFDFDMSDDVKRDAQHTFQALLAGAAEAQELSARGTAIRVCTRFLMHTCDQHGKLPYGPVLGYIAMAGLSTCKAVHETATEKMEYVMPCNRKDGKSVLEEIVETGCRAQACCHDVTGLLSCHHMSHEDS
jgi:hypothetical protein